MCARTDAAELSASRMKALPWAKYTIPQGDSERPTGSLAVANRIDRRHLVFLFDRDRLQRQDCSRSSIATKRRLVRASIAGASGLVKNAANLIHVNDSGPAMIEATRRAPPVSVDISVILEWENVLIAESERCFRMLRQLRKQLDATSRTVEVIVLFNPDQIDSSMIERAVGDNLGFAGAGAASWSVRIEEAHGLRYYELKNEGASRAGGEVIVFIDSDIVPEDGWLDEICRPLLERPEVDVVAGHTYLAFDSIFEKAFALAWFFPLREPANTIHSRHTHFYANSVAFRRELFLRHRFPRMQDGVTRGACVDLAQTLVGSGTPIWTNTGARASHPPPADMRHYVTRAMAQGRDNISRRMAPGGSLCKALAAEFRWGAKEVKHAMSRMIHDRQRVNLPLWQTPAALAIIAGYHSLAFIGCCVTLLLPGYAVKRWQI